MEKGEARRILYSQAAAILAARDGVWPSPRLLILPGLSPVDEVREIKTVFPGAKVVAIDNDSRAPSAFRKAVTAEGVDGHALFGELKTLLPVISLVDGLVDFANLDLMTTDWNEAGKLAVSVPLRKGGVVALNLIRAREPVKPAGTAIEREYMELGLNERDAVRIAGLKEWCDQREGGPLHLHAVILYQGVSPMAHTVWADTPCRLPMVTDLRPRKSADIIAWLTKENARLKRELGYDQVRVA